MGITIIQPIVLKGNTAFCTCKRLLSIHYWLVAGVYLSPNSNFWTTKGIQCLFLCIVNVEMSIEMANKDKVHIKSI